MNPVNIYDNVGPGQNFLFDVKFINIEYIFYKIYVFFNSIFGFREDTGIAIDSTSTGQLITESPSGQAFNFPLASVILKDVLFILIILFITIICYCTVRILEIRKKEGEHLKEEIEEYAKKMAAKEGGESIKTSKNPRWDMVVKYMNSGDESGWRLAVLEADTILEDLLEQLGFPGEGIGEKLKMLDKEKFRHISFAWDAHVVRNKVAHEGTAYILTLRESARVIGLYEQIFRDYDYI